MPKWKETLCPVCHEPSDPLAEYRDVWQDKVYSPREYIEHQLHMSEEEKELRRRMFTEMLAQHDAKKEGRVYH
jgi:hypothetical protein